MKVCNSKGDGNIDIHFEGEKGVYVGLTYGVAEHGAYGHIYISLSPDLAIKVAKEILSKAGKEK